MRALPRFMKKHAKIIAGMAMVSALYAVYSTSYNAGLHALQEQAKQGLNNIAQALFVPIEKYSYLPEVIANHTLLSDTLLNEGDSKYIGKANAYFENVNQIAKVETIYLLNKNGVAIAASNWNSQSSFIGHNYSFRPYFQDAIKGGIGRFYAVGTTSKTPGYYIAYPVERNEQILGVVVVKVDLSNVDRAWQNQSAFEVAVTDEHGITFLSSVVDWKYRPMQPLAPAAAEKVKITHRYDASLKSPLPILERHSLAANSQYVKISRPNAMGHAVGVPYVLNTGKLSWSSWTLNIYMPADKVQGRAMLHTLLAAAIFAFILLALLYWNELRRHVAERDNAKRALETAHTELGEKHRHLEVLNEELLRLANVDELTGSYNRRFFFEITAKMLSGALRHHLALSIIVIDVDFFKRINDEYGHLAGDTVLRQISKICSADLREEDVFARLGGEEFIMALMPTLEQDAAEIAERLRRNISRHRFMENGTAMNVTISCGVAQFHPSELGIESTISRADKALYEAKKLGRNRVVIAKTVDHASANTTPPLQIS